MRGYIPAFRKTLRRAVFESGGTWVAPAGVTKIWATGCAAGGGGGGSNTASRGGGGGGGGQACDRKECAVAPGTSYTITLGSGGSAGATTPTAGGAGGNTTISGSVLTLVGGAGGGANSGTIGAGGAGGGNGGARGGDGGSTQAGIGGTCLSAGLFSGVRTQAAAGVNGPYYGHGADGAYGVNAGGTGGAGFLVIEWEE